MNKTDYYLKTGDPDLDRILAMDEKDDARDTHGIKCERGKGTESERGKGTESVPIILILGGAGTGKTTFALQFATEVATRKVVGERKGNGNECRVFFYSLEQSLTSLQWAHNNFGFEVDAPFADFADLPDGGIQPGRIHLCHFAPLPISATETSHAFEDRFDQLCHMIKKVKDDMSKKVKNDTPALTPVFFIDSLNALATSDLPRNAIYRLFALFRSQGIPAIITAEHTERARADGTSISDDARFLADVVMELSSKESAGHFLTYIQISKSRIRRQALGKHLYKIRIAPKPVSETTPPWDRWDGDQPEGGFLVYPSLPSIVSMTRAPHPREEELDPNSKPVYHLSRKDAKDASIENLMKDDSVAPGACFSIVGPAGTHKLALGLNLATGYLVPPSDEEAATRNLLIISFGSYTAVDLSGVAWFEKRKTWSQFDPPPVSPQPKWQKVVFKFNGSPETPPLNATQLMFRMGHLTPEECFYRIQTEIKRVEKDPKMAYSSVLVWDTAQIRTGFPLLRAEPLFLPTLVDFFREKNVVSVFIGVREDDGTDREMDSALESAADYRMSLSHYPTPYDLAKDIFQPQPNQASPRVATLPKLYEQLVSVVVDNVTGKHYGRHPRWLMVEQIDKADKKEKILKCLETPDCAVELRKRELDRIREMVIARWRGAARLHLLDDKHKSKAFVEESAAEAAEAAKPQKQVRRPEFQVLADKLAAEADQLAKAFELPPEEQPIANAISVTNAHPK